MSLTQDSIRIDADGITVGGKVLHGATRWSARHDPDRALMEISVTLVTDRLTVKLDTEGGGLLGGPLGRAHAATLVDVAVERARTNRMISEEMKAPKTATTGGGAA
jgi:hypothetical protein